MCPYTDWFLIYEPLDSGVIIIGSDAQCDVVAIGNIQIKSYDGIVRTLTNVRHI